MEIKTALEILIPKLLLKKLRLFMEDVYLTYCSGKKSFLETGYAVTLLGPKLRLTAFLLK
jgi:hypothetical protein